MFAMLFWPVLAVSTHGHLPPADCRRQLTAADSCSNTGPGESQPKCRARGTHPVEARSCLLGQRKKVAPRCSSPAGRPLPAFCLPSLGFAQATLASSPTAGRHPASEPLSPDGPPVGTVGHILSTCKGRRLSFRCCRCGSCIQGPSLPSFRVSEARACPSSSSTSQNHLEACSGAEDLHACQGHDAGPRAALWKTLVWDLPCDQWSLTPVS